MNRAEAKTVLDKWAVRFGIRYEIVGSMATKGSSSHDIDIRITSPSSWATIKGFVYYAMWELQFPLDVEAHGQKAYYYPET